MPKQNTCLAVCVVLAQIINNTCTPCCFRITDNTMQITAKSGIASTASSVDIEDGGILNERDAH